MARIVNQHELRIVGMSRSGNHAIIHWIIQQAQGPVCFLNCVQPKTNPFLTARPLEGEQVHLANYPEFDLRKEQQGKLTRKDHLIVSYEDVFLGMACRGPIEQHHDQWLGPSAHRRDVLILRDPYNLFASRLKFNYSEITPLTMVRIWKQHAREFLGRTRHLPHQRVLISYNDWVRRRTYRRQIAAQLGLPFSDAGLDRVPKTGGGSSFEGLRSQGRASRMRVLERWKHYADDPRYQRLFDSQVVELSEAIFGSIPGTEAVRAAISC